MNFILLQSFSNYIDAHIIMGRLQDLGFECWLKDENTVTINPIWDNAMGGIKLMVAEAQVAEAREVLNKLVAERRSLMACPKCGGHELELISTPRNPINWLSAISTFLLGNYALAVEKTYHCFDCGSEFKEPSKENTEIVS